MKHNQKFMTAALLLGLAAGAAGCGNGNGNGEASMVDFGQGFESNALYAPWDGLQDDTKFCCHSTAERVIFSFEVADTTLALSEPFSGERDVEPEDRVEVFFCSDAQMTRSYYGAEIDAMGRVMDYKGEFYRKLDFDWDFETMEIRSSLTPSGYRVDGSVARSELESLGIDLSGGFAIGVFRADFRPGGVVNWYSLVPTADEKPDFHQPSVMTPCRIIPKTGRLSQRHHLCRTGRIL